MHAFNVELGGSNRQFPRAHWSADSCSFSKRPCVKQLDRKQRRETLMSSSGLCAFTHGCAHTHSHMHVHHIQHTHRVINLFLFCKTRLYTSCQSFCVHVCVPVCAWVCTCVCAYSCVGYKSTLVMSLRWLSTLYF